MLAPVDAVKSGNFTGYTGNSLETLKWVRNFIDSNNLMSATVTDREKITIIQNYFIQSYRINVGDTVYKRGISRLLFDGDGTCDDYATTFCFLCDCIDITSYFAVGTADNRTDGWSGHGWNKVKIDGYWFYIDPTWCSNLQSMDEYFLTTDLWSDHSLREEGYYQDIVQISNVTYVSDLE